METKLYLQIAEQLRGLAKLASSHKHITPQPPKEKLDTTQVYNFLRFFGDKA